ncbi:MAG: hypothetical protein EOM19_04855 [Candidatus Moranbacteria bacterium]|nr:hypothetical protein [Candidatus Moranbacteria bacterium]
MYIIPIMIYLMGANNSLNRYKRFHLSSRLDTITFMQCLHEVFTLFEDLCSLAVYMQRKCKRRENNKKNQLWIDIRNHIKHDIREEFDKEDSKKKKGREERLGVDSYLQMNLECKKNYIKVGSTIVSIKEIEDYLHKEKLFIDIVYKEAKAKGFINK